MFGVAFLLLFIYNNICMLIDCGKLYRFSRSHVCLLGAFVSFGSVCVCMSFGLLSVARAQRYKL